MCVCACWVNSARSGAAEVAPVVAALDVAHRAPGGCITSAQNRVRLSVRPGSQWRRIRRMDWLPSLALGMENRHRCSTARWVARGRSSCNRRINPPASTHRNARTVVSASGTTSAVVTTAACITRSMKPAPFYFRALSAALSPRRRATSATAAFRSRGRPFRISSCFSR